MHTQAHVHGVIVPELDFTKPSDRAVFNNAFCSVWYSLLGKSTPLPPGFALVLDSFFPKFLAAVLQ